MINKQKFSAFSLLKAAVKGKDYWERAWRSPEPQKSYDVVIIGGGGHGLGTAYYLAKHHGYKNIAVLEKGWIGGGNTGRNTTIVRSNYMLDANAHFYEHSLKMWEDLSADLNFNVMFSQRGNLLLGHSPSQMDEHARRGNAMRLNGIDAELLSIDDIRKLEPKLDFSDNVRFPIHGGLYQPRAGTARHDAVAWGYARGADAYGVDIIENCEVLGLEIENNRVQAIQTTRGEISAGQVGIAVAGHTSKLAQMVGLKTPIEAHVLQAFVTEGLKPFIGSVLSFGVGHFYMSQSDKGGLVFGGDLDGYNSYAQRGNLPIVDHVMQAGISLMPSLSRLRLLRSWGGVMDMSMDGSPIISTTPIDNFYINGGWCYGGFKATPGSAWVFAHTIAHNAPHALNAAFSLDRFADGAVIDERGAGPTPGWH